MDNQTYEYEHTEISVKNTTKGFAILSAASIIVKVLSLLYIPILLAIIGEEGNGIYAAAYQVYVFVYVLTNSGLPVAISKLVAELVAIKNYKDAFRSFKIARSFLIVLGVLMSILMLIFARPLSNVIKFDKSYLAILALSPTLLFTSVASAYRGYFQGRGNMVPTAVSQIIEQLANTVFTLVFASLLLKYGIEAACAGGTIGTSLGALFSMTFLVMYYKKNKWFRVPKEHIGLKVERFTYKELVKKISDYSIPITLSVGLQYAGNLVDLWNTKARLLVAGFTDSTATTMYNYLYKYTQLMHVPTSIIAALAAAVLPAISGAVAAKNKNSVQEKVNYAFRICLLIVIPAAVGLAVLSRPIYSMIRFGEGSYVMLYGSIVIVIMSLLQIQSITLQGAGKLYNVTINLAIGIIVKILINYIFIAIPSINILGSVIGSVVGYSIPLVLNGMLIRKSLKIKLDLFKLAIKPILASGFMAVVVYAAHGGLELLLGFIGVDYIINAIAAIVAIIIGIAAYFVALLVFKGITPEDLDTLPSKVLRVIPKSVIELVKEINEGEQDDEEY